jgi:membrane protein DedA with SNARE-associated domain
MTRVSSWHLGLACPSMGAISDAARHLVTDYGYAGIFLLMVASAACIPFPSEVTLLVGGWYAGDGRLDFFWVGTLGLLGTLVGSYIAYAIGRTGGRALLARYGKYVFMREHEIDRAEMWWDKHGDAATFFGRLLPVIRSFISLPAGIAEMPLAKFTLYTLLGSAIWSYGLTFVGVVAGHNWEKVSSYMRIPAIIVGIALLALGVRWIAKRKAQADDVG